MSGSWGPGGEGAPGGRRRVFRAVCGIAVWETKVGVGGAGCQRVCGWSWLGRLSSVTLRYVLRDRRGPIRGLRGGRGFRLLEERE
jgi:hypothetical protein